MGIDWGRIGAGVATGGLSEAGRAVNGKGGQPPTSPDFTSAAERQAQAGAQMNRPNQYGPFGSTTWAQGPDGQWTQNTNLAGGLGQGAQSLEGQIGAQGPIGTGDQARDQAIRGIYSQATSRLDPQWQQQEEQTRSRLTAQGLDPGTEAYNNEMGNFQRGKTDAYSSALNNAIQGGTAAQQATFGENYAAQMAPYQQLAQLQGLSQAPQVAQQQGPQYLPAAMAKYQGDLQGYGIRQQGKNSTMGGLGGLGAAAIMA